MNHNGHDVPISCPSCGCVRHVGAGFAARVRILPCHSCGVDIDCREQEDSAEWDEIAAALLAAQAPARRHPSKAP